MKIFVAIPVYDGKLHIQSAKALFDEKSVALGIGDDLTINVVTSNAGISQARNQLASEFMKSDFDRLFFLDSDITFELGAIVKLCHKPADFLGGCYRYKREKESYPIKFIKDSMLVANEYGLLEAEGIPTGFMALSRRVFETLRDKFPERAMADQGGFSDHCYFQMPFKDGHFYGEDFFFCREWSEAGGKIYLDPEINLTHWDFNPTPYEGHIGNWLKGQITEDQKKEFLNTKGHKNVSEMCLS